MQLGMNSNRSADALAGSYGLFAFSCIFWLGTMFLLAWLLLRREDVRAYGAATRRTVSQKRSCDIIFASLTDRKNLPMQFSYTGRFCYMGIGILPQRLYFAAVCKRCMARSSAILLW